jgi:hypothetical protein
VNRDRTKPTSDVTRKISAIVKMSEKSMAPVLVGGAQA